MLGNLKTLTYEIEMEESDVIDIRKRVMHRLALDSMRMAPMCVHGDWMRVFVFKLTLLDIIPAVGKIMLGLPTEFWTKPLAEITEEDEAMFKEIMDRSYTFFESTKK